MRYEIGQKIGKNVYYTGYTLDANDKNDARNKYLVMSGSEDNNDIRINQLED